MARSTSFLGNPSGEAHAGMGGEPDGLLPHASELTQASLRLIFGVSLMRLRD
jgi:hypothetical protein